MTESTITSKSDILTWINTFFKLNLAKLEEACSGALYCQIFEAVHKGAINMTKVNWKASLEHEYHSNYKMLQQAFDKMNVKKEFNIERLTKGKPQETLEFLQFLKSHFDSNFKDNESYDAEARRNNVNMKSRQKSVSQDKVNVRRPNNSKQLNEKLNITVVNPIKEELHDKENKIKSTNPPTKIRKQEKIISEVEKERDFYRSKLNDIQFILDNSKKDIYPELFNLIEQTLTSKCEIKVIKNEVGQLLIKPLSECLKLNSSE